MNIPFIFNLTKESWEEKGVRALFNVNRNPMRYDVELHPVKGLWIAGGVNASGDYKGVEVALVNLVDGELYGASSGGLNYANSNGKIAIQIGVINNISEYNPEGTVIQVGLHNRVGDQSSPFINIRGLRKCFKRKKSDSKLESAVE